MNKEKMGIPRPKKEINQEINEGLKEMTKDERFIDLTESVIQDIDKKLERTQILIDADQAKMMKVINQYNEENSVNSASLSRPLTLKKGVEVRVPLYTTKKALEDLDDELGKYYLYDEANDLDTKNMHAEFYLEYLSGNTKEPYTWVMNYGLKMPIFTKEEYEEASKHYAIEEVETTPPTKKEMVRILKKLGYGNDLTKEEITKK